MASGCRTLFGATWPQRGLYGVGVPHFLCFGNQRLLIGPQRGRQPYNSSVW